MILEFKIGYVLLIRLYPSDPVSTGVVWTLSNAVDALIDFSVEFAEGIDVAPLALLAFLIALIVDVKSGLEFGSESVRRVIQIKI